MPQPVYSQDLVPCDFVLVLNTHENPDICPDRLDKAAQALTKSRISEMFLGFEKVHYI